MPLPVTFARLPEGDNPASLLDDMFQALSGFVFIPCQSVGQNDIELFPFADAPVVMQYTDLAPVFSFMATQTNTGNVRINVMNAQGAGLGPAPAYKGNGGALIEAGDLISGLSYQAYWQTSLNGGAGGFVVNVSSAGGVTPPTPPTPGGPDVANVIMVPFLASGTFTPAANLIVAIVELWGAGAGGGAVTAVTGGGEALGGGGGGSGGYTRVMLTPTQIGVSQPITIGAGGAPGQPGTPTSIGTLATANGGLPGGPNNGFVSSYGQGGAGAAPGTLAAGVVGVAQGGNPGTAGATSTIGTTSVAYGGIGAAIDGGSPLEVVSGEAVQQTGNSGAPNSGSGGGGAACGPLVTTQPTNGGQGGSGLAIVTAYYAAAPA